MSLSLLFDEEIYFCVTLFMLCLPGLSLLGITSQ